MVEGSSPSPVNCEYNEANRQRRIAATVGDCRLPATSARLRRACGKQRRRRCEVAAQKDARAGIRRSCAGRRRTVGVSQGEPFVALNRCFAMGRHSGKIDTGYQRDPKVLGTIIQRELCMSSATGVAATLDDLYRVEGKAELVSGKIIQFMPTGFRPGRVGGGVFRSLDDHAEATGQGLLFLIMWGSR